LAILARDAGATPALLEWTGERLRGRLLPTPENNAESTGTRSKKAERKARRAAEKTHPNVDVDFLAGKTYQQLFGGDGTGTFSRSDPLLRAVFGPSTGDENARDCPWEPPPEDQRSRLRNNDTAPTVLDATAGFGRDAAVLASFGCRVTMVEKNPVVWALLKDGLERLDAAVSAAVSAGEEDAERTPAGNPHVSRMSDRLTLHGAPRDARNLLEALSRGEESALDGVGGRPDVVHLDPMYPSADAHGRPLRRKAAPKKELAFLRALEGSAGDLTEAADDDTEAQAEADATALLRAAIVCAGSRVVVKRPGYAGWLGDIEPDTSLYKSKTRYDVYFSRWAGAGDGPARAGDGPARNL
jgi:hypothetical protein